MKLFDNILLNIGAMKSGTSWLAKQLEDHPDIYLPPVKEVHYFAHIHSPIKLLDTNGRVGALRTYISWVFPELHLEQLRQNLRWFDMYLEEPINDAWFYNLYKNRGAKKYCAEFSNITSILNDEAWTHIKCLCDNIKVVYTMRDPFMRLWSHTRFHAITNGVFEHISQWGETEYRNFLNSGDILQHSCYSHTISTLRRNLEPYQFILLYFEDFRSNPFEQLRHIERFMSISRKQYNNLEFHNPSLPLEMPETFLLASRDAIFAEFEKLDKLGVRIPNNWMLPERHSDPTLTRLISPS
jgi:hypothetical protein